MIYSCASHVGKVRKNNEDYCGGEIIDTNLGSIGIFAIADGMGGHKKGEIASTLAVDNIISFFKDNLIQNNNIKIDYIDDIIKQAYNNVNLIIHDKSTNDNSCEGMGTTLTTAIIYKDSLYVANVGDSRCYLLKENNFIQVTTDHSIVQELIEAKIITEEEAKNHPRRNHITRAIGTDELVIVDIFKHKINVGDKILLATDGLVGFVDDKIIKDIINKSDDISRLTQNLIDIANDISGKDNVSVILIEDK